MIVWHSATGGARQMAEAAAEAASTEPDVAVRIRHAAEAAAADLLTSDGFVFAMPENLASMAGVMKDFFDRTYYPALDRLNGRPCAVMICAGSDGQNTARQMDRIIAGWRLKPIAPPLIVLTHAQTPEAITARKTIGLDDLARCREIGAAMAAGMAAGIF